MPRQSQSRSYWGSESLNRHARRICAELDPQGVIPGALVEGYVRDLEKLLFSISRHVADSYVSKTIPSDCPGGQCSCHAWTEPGEPDFGPF